MLAFALALLAAATTPAAPAKPRAGPVSSQVHSETFTRGEGDKAQSFRVDYTAALDWSLADRKACFFNRCHAVCDMTIRHKTLSRQLWWLPPGREPVLAQNSPNEREYGAGVVTFDRACKAVNDADVARAATNRLRPYQFTEELIHDRPSLGPDADRYLIQHPPAP